MVIEISVISVVAVFLVLLLLILLICSSGQRGASVNGDHKGSESTGCCRLFC